MGDVTRFPWDPPPIQLPTRTTEDTVAALQKDVGFMVLYTAVKVHSVHDELAVVVNTPRGQIVPRGECRLTDGTTIELQDIGMPQPGIDTVATVAELLRRTWETALLIGLEYKP